MLAKQSWRLLANDNSLCHRVYKAKYFPNSSFLEAEEKQSNSSYIWQSLMKGMEVVKLGARWRMGDGTTTRIWQDPWIPGNINFRPFYPSSLFLPIATTVDFLFVQGRREWNIPLLQHLFPLSEVEEIRKIPLHHEVGHDKMIWHFSTDGSYTVKFGYMAYMRSKNLKGAVVTTRLF